MLLEGPVISRVGVNLQLFSDCSPGMLPIDQLLVLG